MAAGDTMTSSSAVRLMSCSSPGTPASAASALGDLRHNGLPAPLMRRSSVLHRCQPRISGGCGPTLRARRLTSSAGRRGTTMSEKPSYLGLLNAISLAETQAHEYLTVWAD